MQNFEVIDVANRIFEGSIFQGSGSKDIRAISSRLNQRIQLLNQENLKTALRLPVFGYGYLDWVASMGIRRQSPFMSGELDGLQVSLAETDKQNVYLREEGKRGKKNYVATLLITKEKPISLELT